MRRLRSLISLFRRWVDMAITRVRNLANNGWITMTGTNTKVRNATNTGWIAFDSGGATGTITGMSATDPVEVVNYSFNAAHQNSPSYGLWSDGPPHPYKDGSGNVYVNVSHSENYRFRVPGSFTDGASWILNGPNLTGSRNTAESRYDNRNWISGYYAEGDTMHAVVHHEWYVNTQTLNGIAGFPADTSGFPNPGTPGVSKWVNAISWARSTNGGASWTTSAATNSSRLILVPEPWNIQQKSHMFGFFHPSNIVKEGSYYYAAVEVRKVTAATGNDAIGGVCMIRTTNLTLPTGWEFWNGSGWETVDHNSYQSNLATQQPYLWFQRTNNYYLSSEYDSHAGQCLRYHTPSGKWVMFGFSGNTVGFFTYSTTPTLASPQWTALSGITNPNNNAYNSSGGRYMSVFDPAAPDQNYQNIGNNCTVLVASVPATSIQHATLTISVA